MLEVRFLGQFEVRLDDQPVLISSRQSQLLFAYLLLVSGRNHRRELIAGQLWPEMDETAARSKLRYALWQLRGALGDDYFVADRIHVGFKEPARFSFDVAGLKTLSPLTTGTKALQKLLESYQGELLPGFYESWIDQERLQLQLLFEKWLEHLVLKLARDQSWRELIKWCEIWLQESLGNEVAFRALAVAYARLGDMAGATRRYEQFKLSLSDLGLTPSEVVAGAMERIHGGESPDLPQELVSLSPAAKQAAAPPIPELTSHESREKEPVLFVARERELAQLDRLAKKAAEGHGGVVFIAGEAGQGKSSLLRAFMSRAQAADEDLVAAYGRGEAYTGSGAPYQAFRDILAGLTGEINQKWTQGILDDESRNRLRNLLPVTVRSILREGQDLIGSYVSGTALLRRAEQFAAGDEPWFSELQKRVRQRLEQPRAINVDHKDMQQTLFGQYCRVLERIASERPLLLLLDDIQWSDQGSLNLLFHLGRRLSDQAILVVGAYRPAEILVDWQGGPHPFALVRSELKHLSGGGEINLDGTGEEDGRQLVDAILDSEPNRYSPSFRDALYRQTNGHPLFTLELLQQFKSQGDIWRGDDRHWIDRDEIQWIALPARVESTIEGRISRLPSRLRHLLDIASTEGEDFTAEVLAEVTTLPLTDVIRYLSRDLDQRFGLIRATAVNRSGPVPVSRYRFRHILYQQYIYSVLDPVQRSHLHGRVGTALERLFGDQLEPVALSLARHFEISLDLGKSVDYLQMAGDEAKASFAYLEAIKLYSHGLELWEKLSAKEQRPQQAMELHLALGSPLIMTRGWADESVEKTFRQASVLCSMLGDSERLISSYWGLWSYQLVRAQHDLATQQGERIMALARQLDDPDLILIGSWTLGISLFWRGEFAAARGHLEQAVSLYNPDRHESLTHVFGQNPGATCQCFLALTLWMTGWPDQAVVACELGQTLATDSFTSALAHVIAANVRLFRGEERLSLEETQAAFEIANEMEFSYWLAFCTSLNGSALARQGERETGLQLLEVGLAAMETSGSELARSLFVLFIVDSLILTGEETRAMTLVDEAIALIERNGEKAFHSELLRFKGNCLAKSDLVECNRVLQHALTVSEEQGAHGYGLRIATDIAELSGDLGPLRDAYARFDEGHDTVDLTRARQFLEQATSC